MPNKVWIRGTGNSNLDSEENMSWFTLGWFVDGIGFGELTFNYNHKTSTWICENETMSRDFLKSVLVILADLAVLVDQYEEKT